MANELNLPLNPSQTGLTITAILIQGNAQVGAAISCTESGTVAGHYSGNMPSVAAGVYGVRFLSAGSQVGTGVIDWDGTKERGLGDLPTVEAIWTHTTRTLTSTALSAADVWGYSGRTLDGTQAANLAAIASIPTNPLLTTDARLNTLDAAISTRLAALSYTEPLTILETASAVEDALTAYGAATPASVWGYIGRALDGAQATALSTIVNIPTNPLLANDSRLDTLVALAQADEVISPTQYRKLTAGTNTAILTKAVTNDGAGNIQLRAAP